MDSNNENAYCSLGSVQEGDIRLFSSDGQQIYLSYGCTLFADIYYGYITRSRDGLSAVVPCCMDQTAHPRLVGFVEIHFNGTVSPMRTIQMPYMFPLVPNMVKDGSDLWFSAREYGSSGKGQFYYADLSADAVDLTTLVNDDTYFVDIINDTLLASNWNGMSAGLMQVGTDLPKTENQALQIIRYPRHGAQRLLTMRTTSQ